MSEQAQVEKKWHRFRHYPHAWSTFDMIEPCAKPKYCMGCEFNHPFCSLGGKLLNPADAEIPEHLKSYAAKGRR